MKKLLLAALLAALVLTACAPSAGQAVEIRSGAYGCRTWYAAAGAWGNCYPASELTGGGGGHPRLPPKPPPPPPPQKGGGGGGLTSHHPNTPSLEKTIFPTSVP